MTERLVRIVSKKAPHFCAGIVAVDGVVEDAAPIVKYMIGWNGKKFADYCKLRGWSFESWPIWYKDSFPFANGSLEEMSFETAGRMNTAVSNGAHASRFADATGEKPSDPVSILTTPRPDV